MTWKENENLNIGWRHGLVSSLPPPNLINLTIWQGSLFF